MRNDIILNKVDTIERCIIRIKEVYDFEPENLKDFTLQDSIILNLQRAIEATIDIAMHIVSEKKLGLPQSSRDSFEILLQNNIISDLILLKINDMIGFRNIAVHNYQKLNLNILQKIIEVHLDDFREFIDAIINYK